ncbi:MAG: DUF1553 domain-containing protein, partial [Verrucomicrobiota bacterium]
APVEAAILVAGDHNKPAQQVERGFPKVLSFDDTPEIPSDASGRLQLAHWITSTNNPLTARVMVNRVWSNLTGAPIIETMDNFGLTGLPPTNQDLLDYLAIRFMENGWSLKKIIREVVLSDTYQLASTYNEASYQKDPANATNWRAQPRQLDAESLRDQMLVVSGQLKRDRPEGSIAAAVGDTRINERNQAEADAVFDTSTFRHRSIYLPVLRDALPDELGLFDFPDPQGTISKRAPTNVAPQSLHLMNSSLAFHQSRMMAEVLTRNFARLNDQVSNAYLLAYSRPASKEEISKGMAFIQSFDPGTPPKVEEPVVTETTGKGKGGKGKGKGKGKGGKGKGQTTPEPKKEDPVELSNQQEKLTAFCQALMMSAEFRTVH